MGVSGEFSWFSRLFAFDKDMHVVLALRRMLKAVPAAGTTRLTICHSGLQVGNLAGRYLSGLTGAKILYHRGQGKLTADTAVLVVGRGVC